MEEGLILDINRGFIKRRLPVELCSKQGSKFEGRANKENVVSRLNIPVVDPQRYRRCPGGSSGRANEGSKSRRQDEPNRLGLGVLDGELKAILKTEDDYQSNGQSATSRSIYSTFDNSSCVCGLQSKLKVVTNDLKRERYKTKCLTDEVESLKLALKCLSRKKTSHSPSVASILAELTAEFKRQERGPHMLAWWRGVQEDVESKVHQLQLLLSNGHQMTFQGSPRLTEQFIYSASMNQPSASQGTNHPPFEYQLTDDSRQAMPQIGSPSHSRRDSSIDFCKELSPGEDLERISMSDSLTLKSRSDCKLINSITKHF